MEDKDRMDRFDERLVTIGERLDRLTVEFEKNQHASELRFRKMEEMQMVLMHTQQETWEKMGQIQEASNLRFQKLEDSEARAWDAINRLTENIDRLSRGQGSNGHDRSE